MSLPKFAFVVVSLLLLTIPAVAGVLFNNFPIDGTQNSTRIDDGIAVSDSFTLAPAAVVNGVNFGVWSNSGITWVDWAIGTTKFDNSRGSGTAEVSTTYLKSFNSYTHIYTASFSFAPLNLEAGTYYLTLQNATPVAGAIGWDNNFTGGIDAWFRWNGSDYSGSAGSFQILGDPIVPEPASWAFLGSGLLAVAALHRKLLRR